MVVDTGIEPVTPSMSRKCATAAPIDRATPKLLEDFDGDGGGDGI